MLFNVPRQFSRFSAFVFLPLGNYFLTFLFTSFVSCHVQNLFLSVVLIFALQRMLCKRAGDIAGGLGAIPITEPVAPIVHKYSRLASLGLVVAAGQPEGAEYFHGIRIFCQTPFRVPLHRQRKSGCITETKSFDQSIISYRLNP